MKPKVISNPVGGDLATAVATAISALTTAEAPALVVDSPLAAAALKAALANADWPGRGQGTPLPWCGTLEQAFNALVVRTSCAPHREIVLSPPRSVAMRRVELAQLLLDSKELKDSLGGSPKAALSLAGQWADLFDGWEWLEADRSTLQAPHLAADLTVLSGLHAANRRPNDRAAWVNAHASAHAIRAWPFNQREVWFCQGLTPSAREIAMARRLWSVDADAITLWTWAPIAIEQATVETMPAPRRMIAANTLEESAWAAVKVILDWRAQGLDDIGVVALDRKAVRRLRALLERSGELLSDRSGWALDTTVAASALVGLNDLLIGQATTQSVLEWIHSPFVFRGLHAQFGFDRAHQRTLDGALRGFGRITGIDPTDLIRCGLLPCSAAVMSPMRPGARLPLAGWADRLITAMEHCGLETVLAQDAAGQSLIAALQELQAQCLGDDTKISAALWHAVLTQELNRARFVEPLPGACVRVVSLSSLSWQRPQAVLMIGADSARLPQRAAPQFFEPSRFAEMGLQNDPQQIESEQFAQFVALWRAPVPITAIATSERPDSEVEFSAWLQLLCGLEVERAGQVIPEFAVQPGPYLLASQAVASQQSTNEDPQQGAVMLGAADWPHGLPAQITVSQAQSLMHCPYQFMLASLMGLAQVPELEEDTAGSDLGSLIHLALKQAKQPFASVQACVQWLTAQIDATLSQPFFADAHGNPLRLAVPTAIRTKLRADALAVVPALGEWLYRAALHEPLAETEHPVRRPLESVGVVIKGRIDRWEKTQKRLIDFKTTDPKLLSKRLGPDGDDIQLPLYAWLIAAQKESPPIDDVRYVAVRRDGVTEVSIQKGNDLDVAVLAQQAVDRLESALLTFKNRLPVIATGTNKEESICNYCSVRGVCRRDESPL